MDTAIQHKRNLYCVQPNAQLLNQTTVHRYRIVFASVFQEKKISPCPKNQAQPKGNQVGHNLAQ